VRVFVKILLWFWGSLVLVALALELTITATTTPVEVRVARFSDAVLNAHAKEAVAVLDRKGPTGVARFLAHLEHGTRIHALLLDPDGRDVTGGAVSRKAVEVARRAMETGQTEIEADGGTAMKARAVTMGDGRRYILVSAVPVGLVRLLHDGAMAQVLRLLAVLATAAVACYALARYVTRPLGVLRGATRALARGDLAVRVGASVGHGTDEFTELGRDFDRMAERLDALVTAERRLLRDISHELRSPLARLNVALGLARQQAGDDHGALDRIEREAERLNTLIGQLLMLARMESGATPAVRETIDLLGIVHEVVDDAAFEAKGRGRTVELVEGCDDAMVAGDPELLRSAVENVVRNAVRHTREGTCVEVGMRRDASGHVRIRVRDHGPGVPDAALPYIFQPFYRLGDARDRGTGGVGLGLTIVDRTIRLHDGTVRAANAPGGGGLVVELTLPPLPA
jgi:signal transduction histidine kinase